MQLRELLNSQQILTPLVSAKPMGQESSMDAFNQILTEKTNDSVSKRSPYNQRADFQKAQTKENKNFSVRTEAIQYEPTEHIDASNERKEVTKVNESKSKKTETERSHETDQDKIKKILREKLKRNAGLNEVEIDELIASVLAEPIKLLELFESNEAFVEELSDLLTGLELNEVLKNDISTQDMKQIMIELEKLIQALEKNTQNANVDMESTASEDKQSFEMKIIQSLSKIISTIQNQNPETVDVKPNEIRRMIVEALVIPTEQTVVVNQNDVKPLPNQSISSELTLQTPMTSQSMDTLGSQPKTAEDATVIAHSNIASGNIEPQNQQSMMKDVDVDVKVRTEDVSKGIGLNQTMMKQPNSITTQTVQSTPPQMKQEVFTQMLDAIKGHMKLSDHGTSMLIKLQPEQLGNVELRLNLQKGIVLAEIKVENEMVKAAIESNLDDLKQSLSNKGYSVDQFNVNVDSGKKNRHETFGQSKKNKPSEKKDSNESMDMIESVSRYLTDEYEGSTINYYG